MRKRLPVTSRLARSTFKDPWIERIGDDQNDRRNDSAASDEAEVRDIVTLPWMTCSLALARAGLPVRGRRI